LSLWEKLGPAGLNKIRKKLPEPWKVMQDQSLLDLIFSTKQHPGRIPVDFLLAEAEKLLKLQDEGKFKILSIDDPLYPEQLRNIYSPPQFLYCRGDLNLLKYPCIAVVGTRKPTDYGTEVTRLLTRDLVKHQFVIVSGMAIGVDAVAHKTALDCDGHTIAVLGCGLDNPYPKTNQSVRRGVEKSGCVVSEFPWGTPPNPAQFPRRNRIISGLSKGVLITEAAEKSGALITVKHAVDQNRDVFAIPGPINSPMSLGPLRVIQQGGYPVVDATDIIEHYRIQLNIPFPPPLVENNSLDLDPEFREIWDLLDVTPVSVDDLLSTLRWSATEIHSVLLKMEMLELIIQLPGKCYVRAVSPVNPSQ